MCSFGFFNYISVAKAGKTDPTPIDNLKFNPDGTVRESKSATGATYQSEAVKFFRKKGEAPEKFNMPIQSDEDQRSIHMPRKNMKLRCDACGAVMYQLNKELTEVESNFRDGRNLKEWEYLDLFDKIWCFFYLCR